MCLPVGVLQNKFYILTQSHLRPSSRLIYLISRKFSEAVSSRLRRPLANFKKFKYSCPMIALPPSGVKSFPYKLRPSKILLLLFGKSADESGHMCSTALRIQFSGAFAPKLGQLVRQIGKSGIVESFTWSLKAREIVCHQREPGYHRVEHIKVLLGE